MTPDEEDLVVEEMRTHGACVTVGGSRCHTDYAWGPEGFVAQPFDEGAIEVHPISEAQLRSVMRSEPAAFRPLLKQPHLRALRTAFWAGDHAGARAHLARIAAISDDLGECAVLDAVLSNAPSSAEVLDLIREKVEGHTAWHVYMGLLGGWQRTRPVAEGGLWFTDRLEALVGVSPASQGLRSSFHALAEAAG